MTTGGQLTIHAAYGEMGLREVAVRLQRPAVARLFVGQHPEAVVKTVPYLYTLCAHAQRAAAQAALAAAEEVPRRPVDAVELWIEFLHENFWRLLLDWPVACGLPPARDAFIAWRGERLGDQRLAATRHLIDTALTPLASQCLNVLGGAAREAGAGMPALCPDDWLAYWQGNEVAMPVQAAPHSVAAAYAQRLAEVAWAAEALAEGRAYPVAAAGAQGWGVGQTVTARGVLTHAVHVTDGAVVRYRVWAPTDGLFADAGPLTALLAGMPAGGLALARQQVDRAVLALDPCLPYVVEFQDA